MKGLIQILVLSWLYLCTKVKPEIWLKPFMNTTADSNKVSNLKSVICLLLEISVSVGNYKMSHTEFRLNMFCLFC